MNVSLEKTDALNAKLTVAIAQEDYEPKYIQALKDFQKKGTFKGFRKGKTPMGYIKKIYGEAALADAVNDLLQKTVGEYLTDNEVNFLGQPLPASDQGPINFDPKNLDAYEFVFDLGMAPEFELKGLDAKIQRFDVKVPSEMIDEEIESYLKRLGTTVDTEETIEETDVIFIKATELEGGEPREGGVEASFAVSVSDIADDKLKKSILKMKQGGTFEFDPFNLEKGREEDFVRKYMLSIEDEPERQVNNTFSAEIERVQRAVPAEINQEFFDKLFGEGKVSSEEEARAEIEKGIKGEFDRQADAVLYKEMQKSLMDANPMDLPEAFLQRWLDTQREKDQPEPTEADRADFILDLRWQLIKDKIAEANDLKVENEEIEQGAVNRVFQYLGPYGNEETVRRLAGSILSNREQVQQIAREVMANKVFDVLKGTFEISDKSVDKDTFKEESERILQPMRT